MIHYETEQVTIWHGDCIDVMRELPDASVDAVVTDPPYAISFMGRKWDSFTEADLRAGEMLGQQSQNWNESATHSRGYADNNSRAFQAWCELWAAEALRVLKPGGHLLAFGGTRTHHRLASGIEDAGFEIRDSIAWLYGSGFPKSLDVSKAIDKQLGAEGTYGAPKSAAHAGWIDRGRMRGEATEGHDGWQRPSSNDPVAVDQRARQYEGGTEAARDWSGWGTALKPAFEPIVVARKPLTGTVAANVLAYGTGALNIDATRIGMTESDPLRAWSDTYGGNSGYTEGRTSHLASFDSKTGSTPPAGRWPANVVLDASQAAALDAQSGTSSSPLGVVKQGGRHGFGPGGTQGAQRDGEGVGYGDTGGASRYFKTVNPDVPFRYTAKAGGNERPKVEREGGGNGRVTGLGGKIRQCNVCGTRAIESGAGSPSCGHDDFHWADPTSSTADVVSHPTVKPLDLMRWLVRLVTPKGGTVLEPFAGSGTTVEAAVLEGFRCIAIEREADYLPLIMQRIGKPHAVGLDFGDWEEDAS